VDANGRFLLGDNLRALAGIDDRVTFVGAGQRVELWQPETFTERQTRTRAHYTTQAKDVLR
jgi:MraZ protein